MTEITDQPPATTAPKSRRTKSPAQARAAGQGALNLVNLALMIWMIWDIRHKSDEEINGRRKLWYMAAFAPPIGPIAYFIFGRKRHAQATEIPVESIESL